MRTFQEFVSLCEATGDTYDAEFRSGAQVIRTGEGGRVGRKRTKTTPERRRMKSVTDPKTGKVTRVPVEPKPRKDVGTPRAAETRVQQPEKERGSKEVAQSYAEKVKAERRAAAKARAAARASGAAAPAAKPKAQELAKTASKLLSKKPAAEKKPTGDKEDHMIKGSLLPKGEPKRPYTRPEKKKIVRTGKRLQSDIQKGREKPASHYQSSLTGKD